MRDDLGEKNKMISDKDQELADIEMQVTKEFDKREKVWIFGYSDGNRMLRIWKNCCASARMTCGRSGPEILS